MCVCVCVCMHKERGNESVCIREREKDIEGVRYGHIRSISIEKHDYLDRWMDHFIKQLNEPLTAESMMLTTVKKNPTRHWMSKCPWIK